MGGKREIVKAVTVIAALVLGLAAAIIFDFWLAVGFVPAVLTCVIWCAIEKRGFKWSLRTAFSKVLSVLPLMLLLTFIGALIGVWKASGIVQTFVFYGMNLLKNANVLFAAFILSAIVGLIIGTSIGTVSTVGVIFIMVARATNVPVALMAGAIVSGAYVADVSSPMSNLQNLLIKSTDTDLMQHIKKDGVYLIAAFVLSAAAYYFLGNNYVSSYPKEIMDLIQNNYQVSFVAAIPIVVLIASLFIFKKRTLYAVIASLAVSLILGVAYYKLSFSEVLNSALSGYAPKDPDLLKLASGGGIVNMLSLVATLFLTVILNGFLEGLGITETVFGKTYGYNVSNKKLSFFVLLATLFTMLITCNQTTPIIVVSDTYKKPFEKRKLDNYFLARIISHSELILAPLIPININAIMVLGIIGVAATEYFPYAFLCLLLPFTLILSMIFKRSGNGKDSDKQSV